MYFLAPEYFAIEMKPEPEQVLHDEQGAYN
jgi:hypothetical protein